ncbi:polysaccharide biosynthesis C-terminal domain-containing protein [Apilactobacillus bombintestini]|uniref:Flippase n=1 Tax=Apilactobacillus bombintestini TaxID=2419772 RepID=A0A387AQA8_9LACO|nr:polysaccharide biosynthesis C-terminal domain-containing protein [Apilactobacillus bombintestini]AYF92183.1 flippase [Apilactobacillus bombintestini]
MRIIKNFLYNASYQIFLLLVPLLTTPYLARTLGPEGVGINSYTNSIIQYFVLFGCVGTNLYANRKIAFVRDNKEKLSQTFWEILFLRLIMLIVSFGLFFIFLLNYADSDYYGYYLAQSVTIIATMLDVSWFFMGIEKFSVTVIRNFVVKIFTLVCIFIFVKSFSDLFLYILIISLSILFGNLTMFSNLKQYVKKPVWKKINILKHFRPSIMLFVPEVATQVYLVLNKTMLGSVVSVQSSGFYDQSDKIVKIVLAIVTATGTVMLPHVANAFANGEEHKTREYLYDSFAIVTAISMPMFMGIVAISSKLVPLFFSSKFGLVAPLLSVESTVILLIAWSNAIGTQYLLPTRQANQYTTSVVLGAVVNIMMNIPLIFWLGTIGAIIATVISEFAVTAYQLFAIRKQILMYKLFKDTYKYFVAGLIMFFVVFILNGLLPFTWTALIIEIFMGVDIYLLLIFIFKANVFKVINKMRKEY